MVKLHASSKSGVRTPRGGGLVSPALHDPSQLPGHPVGCLSRPGSGRDGSPKPWRKRVSCMILRIMQETPFRKNTRNLSFDNFGRRPQTTRWPALSLDWAPGRATGTPDGPVPALGARAPELPPPARSTNPPAIRSAGAELLEPCRTRSAARAAECAGTADPAARALSDARPRREFRLLLRNSSASICSRCSSSCRARCTPRSC